MDVTGVRRQRSRRCSLLLASAVSLAGATAALSGCFLAAAGAGAGGAIYITSRGAESLVNAPVEDVVRGVDRAFAELGIAEIKNTTERGGDEGEIQGEKGDLDVTVHYERDSPTTTQVEVTARENVAEWDKDYAKRVLEIIVRRS